MLNLNLTDVSRGEARIQGQIPPDDPLWTGAGIELLQPLSVDLRARSVGEGVLVRGSVRTTLEFECRRCLERVVYEVDEPVELLFEPLTEREENELAGEVYPLPARGTEVDLGEPLREQLLLHLPMYVLCSEPCRGLCPRCGTNLNEAECSCAAEPVSGPWDALKTIQFD